MQQYNVVIIGGGVAGTTTALALKQHAPNLSIAIIERSAYDKLRLGETLTPHSAAPLRHLNLWNRFLERDHLPSYGTASAWGDDALTRNEFIFTPHGHAWHLNRQAFDRWLAEEAAKQGVKLYTRAQITQQHYAQKGWYLRLQHNQQQTLLFSQFVVDATGRLSIFAKQQKVQKYLLDQLIGIFLFFKPNGAFTDTFTLIEAQPNGWWYSALLPQQKLVIALMTDADLARDYHLQEAERWLAQLDKTIYTKKRLAAATIEGNPKIMAAHTQRLHTLIGPAWLAVGDAATTYDPLSGQGILKALHHGIYAAYAILDYFKGNPQGLAKYQAHVLGEYRAYLDKHHAYYATEQRWPTAIFWQRRRAVNN